VLHLADTEGEIHYNEISSVAVSIHPDDISLIEATNTFSDMLSCCDLETETLNDAQSFMLKRATSEKRALEDKVREYQLQMVNQKVTYLKETAALKA